MIRNHRPFVYMTKLISRRTMNWFSRNLIVGKQRSSQFDDQYLWITFWYHNSLKVYQNQTIFGVNLQCWSLNACIVIFFTQLMQSVTHRDNYHGEATFFKIIIEERLTFWSFKSRFSVISQLAFHVGQINKFQVNPRLKHSLKVAMPLCIDKKLNRIEIRVLLFLQKGKNREAILTLHSNLCPNVTYC